MQLYKMAQLESGADVIGEAECNFGDIEHE